MEMTDLRTLVSVMETGSITAAAKALNRVPSGVTMRTLQLEENLGVSFFCAENKRITLD